MGGRTERRMDDQTKPCPYRIQLLSHITLLTDKRSDRKKNQHAVGQIGQPACAASHSDSGWLNILNYKPPFDFFYLATDGIEIGVRDISGTKSDLWQKKGHFFPFSWKPLPRQNVGKAYLDVKVGVPRYQGISRRNRSDKALYIRRIVMRMKDGPRLP